MTALHIAAKRGRFKIVKCLVVKGAGIVTKDNAEVSMFGNKILLLSNCELLLNTIRFL